MRRVGMISCLLSATIASASCGTEAVEPDLSEAARALRIDRIEIDEREHELAVVGVGAEGQTIARVDVRVGMFTDMIDHPGEVYGRRMTVDVLGKVSTNEGPGTPVLKLPIASRRPQVQAFLLEPKVASALARWGIGFDREPGTASPDGVAEAPQSCWTLGQYPLIDVTEHHTGCNNNPANSFANYYTGEYGNQHGEYRCCPSGTAASRSCRGVAEGMASDGGNSTVCGTTGSGGCAVCWNDSVSYCAVWINEWEGWVDLSLCD